jgi:hypothetical protein
MRQFRAGWGDFCPCRSGGMPHFGRTDKEESLRSWGLGLELGRGGASGTDFVLGWEERLGGTTGGWRERDIV